VFPWETERKTVTEMVDLSCEDKNFLGKPEMDVNRIIDFCDEEQLEVNWLKF